MQLVSAIRRVRRLVPAASTLELATHDYDTDPGKPACAWDDPEAIDALVSALVNDALAVLEVAASAPLDVEAVEAVGLLALVAGQDVEPGETEGTWRIIPSTTPGRMVSVVDPESRHVHKSRSVYRDGYKAHLAVEPDTGLVTDCALTPGDVTDGDAAIGLIEDEPESLEVLADSAYRSGRTRAQLRAAGHGQVIKPIPLRRGIPGGFNRDDFVVDHAARRARCPAGHTVAISQRGNANFRARCTGCPLRARCTTAKGGKTLKITDHDDELVAARQAWRDPDILDRYRWHRPMVERTIAWFVARGHRRVRYRGVARNQLWLATRVGALNLRRLINLGLRHDGATWSIT